VSVAQTSRNGKNVLVYDSVFAPLVFPDTDEGNAALIQQINKELRMVTRISIGCCAVFFLAIGVLAMVHV